MHLRGMYLHGLGVSLPRAVTLRSPQVAHAGVALSVLTALGARAALRRPVGRPMFYGREAGGRVIECHRLEPM